MEKIDLKSVKIALRRDEMEEVIGGSATGGGTNRICLINGMLTFAMIVVGAGGAGLWGAAGGFLTGLSLGNSNGCFNK